MDKKATKAKAHYHISKVGSPHCALCTMFRIPRHCTAVEGDISPVGVCDYFKPRLGLTKDH